jgi:hypothetical protein
LVTIAHRMGLRGLAFFYFAAVDFWRSMKSRDGMKVRSKSSRFTVTLAAVLLLVYVATAAGHWHANGLQDANCQVCHASASVSLSPATTIVLSVPSPISRHVSAEAAPAIRELKIASSLGRAPPSA